MLVPAMKPVKQKLNSEMIAAPNAATLIPVWKCQAKKKLIQELIRQKRNIRKIPVDEELNNFRKETITEK